jgi:hypothetical protein
MFLLTNERKQHPSILLSVKMLVYYFRFRVNNFRLLMYF